ncbi:protein spinster homolog 1-like [Xenopus laevis]|uniref:Protein spinster homolog 1-like n=1 Tax=Xenopus laevis TaxID=8355 RepID=A0A8J0TKH1_XENLA|nr:protein spinster homolog 1-like [Xenopus laevis]
MVLPILMHLPGHGALRFKRKDPHKKTSFMFKVKALLTCRTFIFCIIGYGAGMFAYRGVTVWGPTLLKTSRNGTQIQVPCVASICTFDDKIIFAVLKSFSDAIGLTVSALISGKVVKANAHRLPLISAVTLLTAGHMIGCGVVWTRMTIIIPYVSIVPELTCI